MVVGCWVFDGGGAFLVLRSQMEKVVDEGEVCGHMVRELSVR